MKDDPFSETMRPVKRAGAARTLCLPRATPLRRQAALHGVEQCLVDDRGMQPGVVLVLVPDHGRGSAGWSAGGTSAPRLKAVPPIVLPARVVRLLERTPPAASSCRRTSTELSSR